MLKATLSKKRLQHRCFVVNFAKVLITPILQPTSGCFWILEFNFRSLETIISQNQVYKIFRKIGSRYYKYLWLSINSKLLNCMTDCLLQPVFLSLSSGLMQGSALEFLSFLITITVHWKERIYNFWEGVYINIHINIHTLQASKTGFQCANWIHNYMCTWRIFELNFCHHLKWKHKICRSTQLEN